MLLCEGNASLTAVGATAPQRVPEMVQSHPVLRTAAVHTQQPRKDKNMLIFLTCLFAGAWGHSLYIQSKQAREIERLRSKLWANGLGA